MVSAGVILQSASVFLLGLATWLLYKILGDVSDLKVVAGVVQTKIEEHEKKINKLELVSERRR